MATLPITGLTNGLYQVCTNANIAYAIPIPVDGNGHRADELQLWFEQSATDPTPIGGMVSFGEDATVPTAGAIARGMWSWSE